MAGNSKYYKIEILSSYSKKFDAAVVTPKFQNTAESFLLKMLANISTYLRISSSTGVPWYFIAAIHMRESGMDFTRHLHNGDTLTNRTTHVPAGYPKADPANGHSYTFVESCIDAIRLKGLDQWKDWSIPGMLHLLEVWNGTGYISKNVSNPYLWSGTQWYSKGKYVSDGNYNPSVIDAQLGTATLLKIFLNNYTPAGKKKVKKSIAIVVLLGLIISVSFYLATTNKK